MMDFKASDVEEDKERTKKNKHKTRINYGKNAVDRFNFREAGLAIVELSRMKNRTF